MAVGSGGGGGGSGIRAGKAFVELGMVDKATSAIAAVVKRAASLPAVGLKFAAGVTGGVGKLLSGAGGKLAGLGGGMLGAGGLAGGLLGKGVSDTLSDLAAMDKAAKAFGLSSERASGLFGLMAANGAENARENIESLVTLSGRIKDVLSGTGEESKKLFDGLSVSAQQLSGLPLDDQFFALHEAIMQLPDPMERVNRLMLAYGEDGGKTLIGTLSKGTDELRRQAKGFELTGAEMADAAAAQAALSTAGAGLNRVWQKLAVAVAPTVADAAAGATRLLGPLGTWIGANREAVTTTAAALAGVTALGGGLLLAGTGLSVAGGALTAVSGGLALLASPIGLATAGVVGLGAYFLTATERGKALRGEVAGGLSESFTALKETATASWTGIQNAIKGGDLGLAAKIGVAGIETAWEEATARMTAVWETFKANLSKGWEVLKKEAGDGGDDFSTRLAKGMIVLGHKTGLVSREAGAGMVADLDRTNQESKANRLAEGRANVAAIDADLQNRLALIKAESQGRISGLRAELDALNKQARYAALAAAFRGKFSGKAGEDDRPPPPPNLANLGKSITSFGGFGDTKQIFGDGGGLLKQQLDATKGISGTFIQQFKPMLEEIKDLNQTLEDIKANNLGFA